MFKPKVTVNYPEQKVPMFPKYRGKQVLMRDENGLEKCVACGLCSVACPADAIYLEAAENDGTVMAGPRYAKVYQIHKTRCIFCGYCEEACPVSAIFMGKDYELAVYSKDDFIWDKADLLVPRPPAPGVEAVTVSLAARLTSSPKPEVMIIGAVADIHGNFDAMRRAMARHPDVPFWLCVGDLASRSGAYPEPPAPLYWIKGNNEDFDRIAAWEAGRAAAAATCTSSRTARRVQVGPLKVAGLGGTFAPTWFDTPAATLPHTAEGRQAAALRARGGRGVQAAAAASTS